jgi:hypothetical protein
MREHTAERERLGRVADGVDEGLVGPAFAHGRQHGLAEPGRNGVEAGLEIRGRRGRPGRHPGAAADRAHPHFQLTDQPFGQAAQRRIAVDAFHGQLNWPIQNHVVEASGPVDDLADQPEVVLNHAGQNVHGAAPLPGRQPQAAGRMEMHAAFGG